MAVDEALIAEQQEQRKLWVETPLRESYPLSQAAGWYGHTPSSLLNTCINFPSSIPMCIINHQDKQF